MDLTAEDKTGIQSVALCSHELDDVLRPVKVAPSDAKMYLRVLMAAESETKVQPKCNTSENPVP